MILKPTIHIRNGDRVYKGLDSGRWWENLQVAMHEETSSLCQPTNYIYLSQKQLPGYVILCIMLASDQTLITGNMREKAWPIYIKLGKWYYILHFAFGTSHPTFIVNYRECTCRDP